MVMRRNAVRSMIIGHAVGDALGVPVEFKSRAELLYHPVTDMIGHGTHDMPPGTWSDDTSMTLCLLESIGRLGRIDANDIMQNFVRWFRNSEFTATGSVFDVGTATSQAIRRYMHGTQAEKCGGHHVDDNGNGALMRIAPLALYLAHENRTMLLASDIAIVGKVAGLTHAHIRNQIACSIYIAIALNLLAGEGIGASIGSAMEQVHRLYDDQRYRQELPLFRRLDAIVSFRQLSPDAIKSTGYVVDTLEAAIYCLVTTSSYTECVLHAVNLGDDTDTVAAVAGGLAGLAYGLRDIPQKWCQRLMRYDYIDGLCQYFIEGLR